MDVKKTQLHQRLVKFCQGLITVYQKSRPESVGGQCRFVPSCSCYAHDALEKDGLKSMPRIMWRLMRCNPLNTHNFQYDPYTNKKEATLK